VTSGDVSYQSFAHAPNGPQKNSQTAVAAVSSGANGLAVGSTEHTIDTFSLPSVTITSKSVSAGYTNGGGVSAFSRGFQDVLFVQALPNQSFNWTAKMGVNNLAILEGPKIEASYQVEDVQGNAFGFKVIAQRAMNSSTQQEDWLVITEIWAGGWQPYGDIGWAEGETLFTTPEESSANFSVNDKIRLRSDSTLTNANGPWAPFNPGTAVAESVFSF